MTVTLDRLGEGVEKQAERRRAAQDPSKRFRADIQGLRAIAVTLVVLYHCGVTLVGGGYVGVDVFFVISGFLITGHLLGEITSQGRISLPSFYARRMRRLLPPALPVVVTTVVLARLIGPVLQTSRTTTDGFFTLFYAMNYRLAGQGIDYQMANAAPSPLQHFWSLAVEEQFYVVWPLGLIVVGWVTRRASARVRVMFAGLVILAITGVSFAMSVSLTPVNAPLAYYSIQTRAWELGVGAIVAVTLPLLRRVPSVVAGAATWCGLGAIVFGAVTFTDSTPFPGSAALWPVLGAAFVIGGGTAAPSWGLERILRGRMTQLVGNVSYGWYLWHWPALILGPSIFGNAFSIVERVEVSMLALWIAVLSYLLLERPMPRLRIALRRWIPIGLTLSAVAGLALAGAYAARPSVQGNGATVAALDLRDPTSVKLTAALRAGIQTQALPMNITPAVDQAKNDYPKTGDCHLAFTAVKQPHDCTFGDKKATRTVLLFGDSHAQQWFPAVTAFAETHHYRLLSWTKSACQPADVTLVQEDLKRKYTECDDWKQDRLAAIKRLHPDLIISSQANNLPGTSVSIPDWARATARTMRSLAPLTDHLVFIGDTPKAAFNVPDCVAERLDSVSSCNVKTGKLSPNQAAYGTLPARNKAVLAAMATVDVATIDPTPWLCIESVCPAVVGNVLTYRDDSHMSPEYAAALEPALAQTIDNALASKKETSSDHS